MQISQPQKVLASAGSVIAQSTQLLLKARFENKTVNVKELFQMNADTIALLGHVSGDLSQFRRGNIRPYLRENFYSLCSIQVPISGDTDRTTIELQLTLQVSRSIFSFYGRYYECFLSCIHILHRANKMEQLLNWISDLK